MNPVPIAPASRALLRWPWPIVAGAVQLRY